MKITLDSNCLISLKTRDGEYAAVRALVDLHPDETIVYIPAIAASENQRGNVSRSNFVEFQESLAEIGCEKCALLMPMAYLDICYLDYAIPVDEQMVTLERRIHDILFPSIPFLYAEYSGNSGLDRDRAVGARKWIRAKCDVQAIWCHIHGKNDIFVTQDGNFHKRTKKPRLADLGAPEILRPSECLSRLEQERHA